MSTSGNDGFSNSIPTIVKCLSTVSTFSCSHVHNPSKHETNDRTLELQERWPVTKIMIFLLYASSAGAVLYRYSDRQREVYQYRSGPGGPAPAPTAAGY